MTPEAETIWNALEFRKPMLLRNVEPLDEAQLRWCDPARPDGPTQSRDRNPAQSPARNPIKNSVAWQLWHIAEVEDNWVRTLQLGQDARYPFPAPHRATPIDEYPPKQALLAYLREVRELSRARLDAMQPGEFDRTVTDPDFGDMAIRALWAGVVTSFAWHAGQAAMTAKLVPNSTVTAWNPSHWSQHADKGKGARS